MHGEVEVYYHVLLNRCMRWIYVVSFALRQLYLPGKRSQPLNMRPSGPQSRFERFSEEKRSFHLGGIGPRYLGPPQPVYWSLLSELSWLHRIPVIAVKFNHPCDKSSKKLQDVIGGQVTIPTPPRTLKLGSFGACLLLLCFGLSCFQVLFTVPNISHSSVFPLMCMCVYIFFGGGGIVFMLSMWPLYTLYVQLW